MATKIVVVLRGECSFVTKVRNAERAGASLLVVADHQKEDVKNVIMGDDGTGTGIRIPSMLIGKEQGRSIIDFANKTDSVVTLSAEFVMPHPDNTVEMELWYSSSNTLALDFIKEFEKYMVDLQDSIDFMPRFVTWGCTGCSQSFKERECFSGGKYCAPNHGFMKGMNVKGSDILVEDLREHCLHDRLKTDGNEYKWWDYMKHIHQQCFSYIDELCSKSAHESIDESYEDTMKCVDQGFWDKDYKTAENSVLKKNAGRWKEYGTLYWPSVTINQVTYRGDITAENILEIICAALASKPNVCLNFYKEEHIAYKKPSFLTANRDRFASVELLIGIVVLLIGINVVLVFCYRRCQKREMEENLGDQVGAAVSHYIAVSEQVSTDTRI